MKHVIHILLTVFMVTALLLSSAAPVFAEEPPPPPSEDPGGGVAQKDAQPAQVRVDEADSGEESIPAAPADTADPNYVGMPNYSPDGAATSGMGAFQGEEMINTGGNPVQAGSDLQALAASAAYACAPGTLPAFMGGTCILNFTTAQAAVNAASPGWTIWLTPYFDDGVDLYPVDKPLTIQGDPSAQAFIGDIGGYGSIIMTSGNVTIKNVYARGQITSVGYGGTLRLQDVVIDAPISGGVYIETNSGSVILSQVFVDGSLYGSYVDVSAGSGTVTVLNSIFDNTVSTGDYLHNGFGLRVISNNTVKVENISASNNYLDGLYVTYAKGLSIKNGFFSDNGTGGAPGNGYGYGIYGVDQGATHGPVLLQNLSVMANDEEGAYLFSPGSITITNSNFTGNSRGGLNVSVGYGSAPLDGVSVEFNASYDSEPAVFLDVYSAANISASTILGNGGKGLYVQTWGVINLKQLLVGGNQGIGAELRNDYIQTIQGVNVIGGLYSNNGDGGLYIRSRGSVTLNGVTAMMNNWDGGDAAVDIDNCLFNGSACIGIGSVTFTNSMGANSVKNNEKAGVWVTSKGNITITSLIANDNLYEGATLANSYGVGNVTVSSSTMNQNGRPYDLTPGVACGLMILSNGSITLDRVQADKNTDKGISLWNASAPSAKPVTLKRVQAFANQNYGVEINSRGAVTINHLLSLGNSFFASGYGLSIDNTWSGSTSPVSIQNTLGDNMVDENGYGVTITSRGTVSIKGLVAIHNMQVGLFLDNSFGVGSVSITNSQFNENFIAYGMEVHSKGIITLSNVQASGNGTFGTLLQNNYLPGKSVTVNKGVFSGNKTYGLEVLAGGTVTLNAIQASQNNTNSGLIIDNNIWGAYNVSILSSLGVNQFNDNGWDGVYIQTAGNVVISKAVADRNTNNGYNFVHTGTAAKTITLTCASASVNSWNIFVTNLGAPVTVTMNGAGITGGLLPTWGYLGSVNWVFNRTNCP